MTNQKLLGHYTSVDVLNKILSAQKLWMTNISFQNDRTEYYHGLEQIQEWLRKFESPPELVKRFFEDPLVARELELDSGDPVMFEPLETDTHFYTFSMSLDSDLLSQWRGYCPDGGVCILFDPDMLIDSATERNGLARADSVEICECIYSEKDKVDDLKKHFDDVIQEQSQQYDLAIQNKLGMNTEFAIGVVMALRSLAARTKSFGFHEEKEHRLILQSARKPAFRAQGNNLLPYQEFAFDLNAIAGVVLGPGNDQALLRRSLGRKFRFLKFDKELDHIPIITESGLSFRR